MSKRTPAPFPLQLFGNFGGMVHPVIAYKSRGSSSFSSPDGNVSSETGARCFGIPCGYIFSIAFLRDDTGEGEAITCTVPKSSVVKVSAILSSKPGSRSDSSGGTGARPPEDAEGVSIGAFGAGAVELELPPCCSLSFDLLRGRAHDLSKASFCKMS